MRRLLLLAFCGNYKNRPWENVVVLARNMHTFEVFMILPTILVNWNSLFSNFKFFSLQFWHRVLLKWKYGSIEPYITAMWPLKWSRPDALSSIKPFTHTRTHARTQHTHTHTDTHTKKQIIGCHNWKIMIMVFVPDTMMHIMMSQQFQLAAIVQILFFNNYSKRHTL